MTTRSRATALVLSFACLCSLATHQSRSQAQPQDPAKPSESSTTTTPAAKRKYDPSRRVPPYFGQVALSPEQREAIYKIRKTQLEKIDQHKKEIAKLEEQMMTECEAILTETQKKLLENLRHAAPINSTATSTTAAAKSKPAPNPPAEKAKQSPKED